MKRPRYKSFKSGDIVRWLPDGNLQFLGRKDRRVKINDVSLDLGDIESYVINMKNIKECFVDYVESLGVVLYYVGNVEREYLRDYLSHILPPYHLPSFIISVENFPLNINGKIDREVLKNLYLIKSNSLASSCNKSVLNNIAEIWASALNHNNFCYDTSFFAAGGDSFRLMKLCVKLEEKFNTKITPTALLDSPTIRDIAHLIQNNSKNHRVTRIDHHSSTENKIAIIAMNVRAPSENDLSNFWEKIRDGKELIYDSHFANNHDTIFGTLSDYEYFSPERFGMTDREAELLDPQHRILLEMAADLLHESGYKQSAYDGKIGIFASCGFNYYFPSNICKNFVHFSDHERNLAIMANEKDFVATRIAYKLDLKGPALAINTACSSSLVSVIKACESLLSRESDTMIAGGISLVYPDAIDFMPCESVLYSRNVIVAFI